MKTLVLMTSLVLSLNANALTLDEIYKIYSPEGITAFSTEHGKQIWISKNISTKGDERHCNLCHGNDLSKPGMHIKTKKVIDPLARSANPERFTDPNKIEKWFKRNCKWTLGRECSNQEKGDLIRYLTQF